MSEKEKLKNKIHNLPYSYTLSLIDNIIVVLMDSGIGNFSEELDTAKIKAEAILKVIEKKNEYETILRLDNYEAINLHWLLSIAYSGVKDISLNTGDWNGTVMYKVEDALFELDNISNRTIHHPNVDYPEDVTSWEKVKRRKKQHLIRDVYIAMLGDKEYKLSSEAFAFIDKYKRKE